MFFYLGESWLVNWRWLADDVMLAQRQQSAARPNCLFLSSSLSAACLGQPTQWPTLDRLSVLCRRISLLADYVHGAANEWVGARERTIERTMRDCRRRHYPSFAMHPLLINAVCLCLAPTPPPLKPAGSRQRHAQLTIERQDLWWYFACKGERASRATAASNNMRRVQLWRQPLSLMYMPTITPSH